MSAEKLRIFKDDPPDVKKEWDTVRVAASGLRGLLDPLRYVSGPFRHQLASSRYSLHVATFIKRWAYTISACETLPVQASAETSAGASAAVKLALPRFLNDLRVVCLHARDEVMKERHNTSDNKSPGVTAHVAERIVDLLVSSFPHQQSPQR